MRLIAIESRIYRISEKDYKDLVNCEEAARRDNKMEHVYSDKLKEIEQKYKSKESLTEVYRYP
jgi:hypothetical protein